MVAAFELQANHVSSAKRVEQAPGSRPILVAVDLLPDSEKLVLWACKYAQSVGAAVSVVHAVHEPISAHGFHSKPQNSNQVLEPLGLTAGRMMDAFFSRLRVDNSDLTALQSADKILVAGLPQTRIVEIAQLHEAQLLVLGHRKRAGLQRFLGGSTAWHVMQNTSVPVVVIAQRPEDQAGWNQATVI